MVMMLLEKFVECPHCKKIIGTARIRTIKIGENTYTDKNEVECPRCGRLIGHLTLKEAK